MEESTLANSRANAAECDANLTQWKWKIGSAESQIRDWAEYKTGNWAELKMGNWTEC